MKAVYQYLPAFSRFLVLIVVSLLGFLLPQFAMAQNFECRGRVRSEIMEDLARGMSKINYTLRCQGKRFKLQVLNSDKIIPHNSLVRVKAKKMRGRERNTLRIDANSSDTGYIQLTQNMVSVSGLRTALIIRVNSNDGSVPCSEADLERYMWSGNVNVSKQFAIASHNNLSFVVDGNGDGRPDVITVSIPYDTVSACNYSTWGSAARSEASKLLDLSKFQHLMYVLPNNVNCGWAGLASLGGGYSYYHGKNCTWQPTLFQHELGHNLGMHHSGTVSGGQYADHSCAMGNPSGALLFNAAKRHEQGWLPAGSVATAPGRYILRNLMLTPSSGAISSVRLNKPDTNETYFVSYRQRAIVEEGGLRDTYHQKVSVTRNRGFGSISYLDAILGVGQSFTDLANSLTITVLAIDSTAQTAEVVIDASCSFGQSVVQISPASQAAGAGATKSYTVSVTNKDSTYCSQSSYSLSAQLPSGWSSAFTQSSLQVNPGQTATTQLTVTSSASAVENSYAIRVLAGRSGESTKEAQALFLVDLTAPLAPTGVGAVITKQGNKVKGVNVTCSGATDQGSVQSGIAGHRMYRDGLLVCSTASNSCLDPITTNGTYTYRCAAQDGAGNLSQISSASATVTLGGSSKPSKGGKLR